MEKIKDNWFFIVFIFSVIVWYANTTSRLGVVEAKITEQQTYLSKLEQITTDVAVMKANVEFIKERIK